MRTIADRTIDGLTAARRFVAACVIFACLAMLPVAAQAQVSGNATLATSEIFRGESTSGDDAALSFEVSYDDPGGLFAGASATLSGGEHDPHFNGSTQYAGYAFRSGETSFELGVIHRDYRTASVTDTDYRAHYFEGFVGVTHKNLRARIYVSPDYLQDGRTSYYGELNGTMLKLGNWSLMGHSGLSAVPPDPGNSGMRFYYDLSVQANRNIGKFKLGLGVAMTNYPVFGNDDGPGFLDNNPRAFATISRAF